MISLENTELKTGSRLIRLRVCFPYSGNIVPPQPSSDLDSIEILEDGPTAAPISGNDSIEIIEDSEPPGLPQAPSSDEPAVACPESSC